ncbi:MAG TPA: metalloregulator ArsR/SmtB family transcription factor, partial [Candidatus Limnocylindrales bacterium]|nr:metalloregulator ArsR/SmtB family transcription factor [Candidatus Limnocylindrales bacterium]
SGLGDWVVQASAAMTPADKRMVMFIGDALALPISDALPVASYPDFPALLRAFGAAEPLELRDRLLDYIVRLPILFPACWKDGAPVPSFEQVLASREAYVDFMQTFQDTDEETRQVWVEGYDLISDPPRLQRQVGAFLARMWDEGGLRDEWQHSLPLLNEAVSAFQKQSFGHLTALESVRAVTGRDLSTLDDPIFSLAETIVFVPSTQIGPYVSGMVREKTLYLLFGARLPKGAQSATTDLSRAELLIRLNALADDTRLHMLELLTQHESMCAQELIEALGVSQSTASRHLSQLSASGYVTERRRDVNKCYSLNSERVNEVLRALSNFLTRQ